MGGIKPKKVYLYDEDGAYLREYESISEFSRQMNGIEQNAFSNYQKKEILILEDGRVAALSRVGREFIRFYKRYLKSEYTIDYRGRKIAESKILNNSIELFNMDNEVISVFKNMYIYKKLLNITSRVTCPSKEWSEDGLKLRYVDN